MADSEALTQFANTHDPLLNFRWVAFNLPFNTDPRHVEKVSLAWPRYESIPIYSAGSNSYYHSVYDTDALNITFYEDKDLTITKMLTEWRRLIQDGGYYGLPVDYKKNISIALLDNSGQTTAIYEGVGAWPSAIDNLDLAYDSSEKISISVTFTIDTAKITPNTPSIDQFDGVTWQTPSNPNLGDGNNLYDIRNILGLSPNNVNSDNNANSGASGNTSDNGWSISTNARTSINAPVGYTNNGSIGNTQNGYPFDPNFPDYGINNPNAKSNTNRFPAYPIDPNFPDYSGNTKAPGGSEYVEYDPNFPDYYPSPVNGNGQRIEYDPNFPDYSRPKVVNSGMFSFSKKAKTINPSHIVIDEIKENK